MIVSSPQGTRKPAGRAVAGFTLVELPAVSRRKAVGFTLVELLVVVAIIALLVAIIVPSLRRAKDLARITICGSNLNQVGIGVILYAKQYNGMLPPINRTNNKLTGTGRYQATICYQGREGQTPLPEATRCSNLGIPYEAGTMPDPKVMYCPLATGAHAYENYPQPWGIGHPTATHPNRPYMWASPYSQFVRSSFYYIPYKDGSAANWHHRWDRLTSYPVAKALCLDYQWSHPNHSYCVLMPNGSVRSIITDEPQPDGQFEVFDLWVDNLLAR